MSEKLFTVGKIVNTHGIRGEVKVMPHTDFADQRFAPKSQLYIVPDKGARLKQRWIHPVFIKHVHP